MGNLSESLLMEKVPRRPSAPYAWEYLCKTSFVNTAVLLLCVGNENWILIVVLAYPLPTTVVPMFSVTPSVCNI